MKKTIVILLMLMFLPQALASSFVGWIDIGERVTYGNVTLAFLDVDPGRSIYVAEEVNNSVMYYSLIPRSIYNLPMANISIYRVFLGDPVKLFVNGSFPPVFVGQEVRVGNLTIKVSDVTPTGFEVVASYGGESKVFKTSTFTFANYTVTIIPRPLVFKGEVKIGDNITYENMKLEIESINMTLVNNQTNSVITVGYAGKSYRIEEGDTAIVGDFIVKYIGFRCIMVNNMCDPRIFIEVYLRALGISVSYDPSREFTVYEGHDYVISPYIFRVNGIADDMAYVSILNSCYDELESGVLNASKVWISPIIYDGLSVGLVEVSEDQDGEKGTFITFYNPKEKPGYLALLNITVIPPSSSTALVPTKVQVIVRNVGNRPIYGGIVEFIPGAGFRVLNEAVRYIPSLDPGKEKVFEFTVVPLTSGSLALGKVKGVAPIPYPLACGGLKFMEFSSNVPKLNVKPLAVNFAITAPREVPAGSPFDVKVSIKAPQGFFGNLSLSLPNGMGLLSNGHVLGGNVVVPVGPGTSVVKLVAVTPGTYVLKGELIAYGKVLGRANFNVTVLTSSGQVSTVTKTVVKTRTVTISSSIVTKKITTTKTVQITKTVPISKTSIVTETLTATSRFSLLSLGLGILIGAGIIILIAWIQAHRSS
ncbi:hypothetical protein A3L04_10530 [Thermococcus chitonophagus]|uniref:S-layer protein n=1 Tax=Thermococcus chitonophagus TaxID=54262 RepID=A0A160VTM6_9EURY|nr:hypothetical protein [Thermococcus chitonophagus]ASJ17472.1 hypothetical protein A3L04_10530 [Thermococcus chitonophagus]CUX78119.1 hypothetical protein CHITON_1340 [Thermococcus chitonophagus]